MKQINFRKGFKKIGFRVPRWHRVKSSMEQLVKNRLKRKKVKKNSLQRLLEKQQANKEAV